MRAALAALGLGLLLVGCEGEDDLKAERTGFRATSGITAEDVMSLARGLGCEDLVTAKPGDLAFPKILDLIRCVHRRLPPHPDRVAAAAALQVGDCLMHRWVGLRERERWEQSTILRIEEVGRSRVRARFWHESLGSWGSIDLTIDPDDHHRVPCPK